MIEAITFDFWDTLAIDDSDEAKRTALGLPSKAEARMELFIRKVTTKHPHIAAQRAVNAYQKANERFRHEWHHEQRTPGVPTRISYAYEELGLLPPPGHYARLIGEIDELAREIEVMEIRIAPDFVSGVHNTIYLLAQQYKLGIISDTIHTNGRGIRGLLAYQGLLQYFSFLVFSDEVGAAKPSPLVFRLAALGLATQITAIAHVGDRESNDIAGPLNVGMKAILFTGAVDRGSEKTRADAICRHMSDLPQVAERLR